MDATNAIQSYYFDILVYLKEERKKPLEQETNRLTTNLNITFVT